MRRTEIRGKAMREELDSACKKDGMVDEDSIPVPTVFICHFIHGLGNGLRELAN